MTHARLIPVLALALVLSGCDKPAPAPAPPPAMAPAAGEGLALDLDTGGLILVIAANGATRPVTFGLAKAQALSMLTKAQGLAGKESVNDECGAGPLTFVAWPDGLTALFQDGKFAGWSVDERGAGTLAFMNGVGIGSTRAELAAQFPGTKVEETSLGVEFRLPDDSMTGGLLNGRDQAATITDLWAGVTCMFR